MIALFLKLSDLRKGVQVLGFVVLNLGFTAALKTGIVCPALFCYACPLAMFACPFGTLQHFVVLAAVPLLAGGTIGLYATLLGRAFCGWFCPFGTVQDIVGKLNSKKLRVSNFPWTKFIVLGVALVAAYVTTETVFCRFCPSGSLFAAFPYVFMNAPSPIPAGIWVHVATFLVVVFGVLLIERVWCRYACPVGAIFGSFNRISLLSMKVDLSSCGDCKQCLRACPMGINNVKAIGSSTDCTRCGKCIEACHKGVIGYRMWPAKSDIEVPKGPI